MERPECLPQATWDLIPPEAQVVLAAVIAALEARAEEKGTFYFLIIWAI